MNCHFWLINGVFSLIFNKTIYFVNKMKIIFFARISRKLRKRLKYDSCSSSPIRSILTKPQSKPIDAQYVGDDFFIALMNMDPVQKPIPEGKENEQFLMRNLSISSNSEKKSKFFTSQMVALNKLVFASLA